MSPASKSKTNTKTKEKPSARAAKEQQKASSKHSGSPNPGNGSPESAYNSGTLITLDTAPVAYSPPLQSNGHLQNMDETDAHSGSSHGTVAVDYDSLSNNESCSGESEDHKEKVASISPRQETIPGSDNDKREKIRQKNEKKHLRQKERRAQELHERCCSYLKSRKLELLSQQLVAMGFSSEQATFALALNKGKLEESVNWLFEGSEDEARKKDIGNGANLKIDIGEELARVAALEVMYKCSKQEVERAVVACEGDLGKAEETLRAQKLEPPATPPKPDEKANVKLSMRVQEKPTLPESGSVNLIGLKAEQHMLLAEKRWPVMGPSSSVSYPMASYPLQFASSSGKPVSQLKISQNEGRNILHEVMRQPIVMMQRPQSQNANHNPVTNTGTSPPGTNGWYTQNVPINESMKLNRRLLHNQSTGNSGPEYSTVQNFNRQTQSNRSPVPDNLSSHAYYPQTRYTKNASISQDPAEAKLGIARNAMGASSPLLKVPSSLGLFSGWGSTGIVGSSSHVDWNTRDMMSRCDYNSVDWTLGSHSMSSRSSGSMIGICSNGIRIPGLEDGGMATSSVGVSEWTSPFEGNDIFSMPRQFFVISPSKN